MSNHRSKLCGSVLATVLGSALLATALPVSAGTITPTPYRDVALSSPLSEVAARRTRQVKARRHYVRGRHYYYRRHNNAFPAAALGLFAGALGAAMANDYYDDGYYSSGYGYPSYGYGYGYPSYGYATPAWRPRYYGSRNVYSGPVFRGGYGGGRGGHIGGQIGRSGGATFHGVRGGGMGMRSCGNPGGHHGGGRR